MEKYDGPGGLPPSPSSSTASAPDFTQRHTSFHTRLLSLGLSEAVLEEYNQRYNHPKTIRLMPDEVFWEGLYLRFVTDESCIDGWIDQETARYKKEYNTAKIKILLADQAELPFRTDEQKSKLITALQTPSVCGYKDLIECLA
ncbi:MAG: hypothetical protein Q9179_007991, partial [Wetmoreana sp. 5 TL-2023]